MDDNDNNDAQQRQQAAAAAKSLDYPRPNDVCFGMPPEEAARHPGTKQYGYILDLNEVRAFFLDSVE